MKTHWSKRHVKRKSDTMDVVIVESPAKAKTINKYLGNGYSVIASFGHGNSMQLL